jgi:hypothetical protein
VRVSSESGARRWEHELYFRDVKRQLRKSDLLQSHTVETGAQDIAALVLASAILAEERARAATAQIPPLRVSFVKVPAGGAIDVALLRHVRGLDHRAPEGPDRATRPDPDAPVRDGEAAVAELPRGRAPARDGLAASAAERID